MTCPRINFLPSEYSHVLLLEHEGKSYLAVPFLVCPNRNITRGRTIKLLAPLANLSRLSIEVRK